MDKIIKNVTVLYGGNLEMRPNAAVWIREGKFHSVLTEAEIPDAVQVVDGNGLFLVPGLIDLHVHVVWDGSEDPVQTLHFEGHDQTLIRAIANCNTQLSHGVTTIRDLGSVDDIAIQISKGIEQGMINGPTIIASGKTLTMTGGHDPFWARFCDGPAEALKGVREQIYKNAKVIKVSASGGVYGQKFGETIGAQLSYDELKVICDEAHHFGLKVASHAIARQGILNSILAGVDTIEHGHFLDDELVQMMEEQRVAWVPTLYVYQQIAHMNGIPQYAKEKAQAIIERHVSAFSRYFGRNILIGAGSDAGSPITSHPSVINELFTMNQYINDKRGILKTATVNAGKILGSSVGQVKEGYEADFILVSGNPLTDLHCLENVNHVYISGNLKFSQ